MPSTSPTIQLRPIATRNALSALGQAGALMQDVQAQATNGVAKPTISAEGIDFISVPTVVAMHMLAAKGLIEATIVDCSPHVSRYLHALGFGEAVAHQTEPTLSTHFEGKLYVHLLSPFDEATSTYPFLDATTDLILAKIKGLASGMQLYTAVSLILSELTDNAREHSESAHVALHFQHYPEEGVFELCIADTGHGIYESYATGNFELERDTDQSALNTLLRDGLSTKPGRHERGMGIRTSRQLAEGMQATFTFWSGEGIILQNAGKKAVIHPLPDQQYWQGVLIYIRCPDKLPPNFNYINYLD